jgi:signal transduction histidine kinase/ActR/RegA family two-component response regulator
MMRFKGSTIQGKLVRMVLLVSAAVLLLACSTILTYEFVTFRQTTIQQAAILGRIIAANSTAALAFENPDDAAEILSALKAEAPIEAAGLYTKQGRLFSHYPSSSSDAKFPVMPEGDGYRFVDTYLIGIQPVTEGEQRLGTLYVKWNLTAAYQRFKIYGASIILIITVCFLAAAYGISKTLRVQISQPILELAEAAKTVSERRDYSLRATRRSDDEVGLLTDVFNGMLTQIEGHIAERKETEIKIESQLSRLQLLERITRATAERQDLRSIFQVMVGTLEDNLPLDFACVCLYDASAEVLTVSSAGSKNAAFATNLGLMPETTFSVGNNGLSTCVQGNLVYEPDVRAVPFPFPQRLAASGLLSFVAAPLSLEDNVLGIVIAARCAPDSFSSADCEFIRQLSEHVALSAHQTNLYTALQGAYDDLRQTQQAVMQQERLRAVGQMASGIAHDINNAISPIALYTETLLDKEPNLSARARDYLQVIQHASEDVAHTIARMREFYREREPQLVLTPVDLNAIVHQVKELTHAKWSDMALQHGVVIRMVIDRVQELPTIMGIENEIREALVNLVFNAVDAMPEGGTLTIRTVLKQDYAAIKRSASAGAVSLEVSDTGLGMDPETLRRCLEPFFTTKGERGTGLGLAMVYGTVQRHSGAIQIQSDLGNGTTVRLIFPVATRAASPRIQQIPAKVAGSLRILIVDDDPLLIRALRETLEDDGHSVATANGGQAGIDVFAALHKEKPFSLVITDLGMPHVDGRKVSAAIKALSPTTPVILFTGWGHRLVAEGDIPDNVDRVLNKPPKLHDLRTALLELTSGNGAHH